LCSSLSYPEETYIACHLPFPLAASATLPKSPAAELLFLRHVSIVSIVLIGWIAALFNQVFPGYEIRKTRFNRTGLDAAQDGWL